ncbi:hypothetical protein AB0N05_13950 [Nocardia sp. NPDC051030]|uniref:hypothetical protein n=1 Tax=Nocardia sp. NPDC051030 TaxID=3155162 RepID=UPI0034254E52
MDFARKFALAGMLHHFTQSGNAYLEGFTPFWEVLFAHANDRAANFALETHGAEITTLIREFLVRKLV